MVMDLMEAETKKIKIILAVEPGVLRECLKALLSTSENIEVVAGAKSGQEITSLLAELKPDILLLDIAVPELGGSKLVRNIRESYPEIKTIVFSRQNSQKHILSAIRAGASGYILKKTSSADLIFCIEAVYRNDFYLYPTIAKRKQDDGPKQFMKTKMRTSQFQSINTD